MLQWTIPTGHAFVKGCLQFDEPSNTVWGAATSGELVTIRLLDRRAEVRGAGYDQPVAAVPNSDGLTVVIVDRSGQVWLARRDQADQAGARLVATVPSEALAAQRHPDTGLLLVLTSGSYGIDPGPIILTVDLESGAVTTVAGGLTDAQTFVVDERLRTVVVLSAAPGVDPQLTVIGLDDGAVSPVPGVLPQITGIVTSPDPAAPGVVAVLEPVGSLALIRPDGTTGASMNLGAPIDSLTRWRSLIIAASGQDLILTEWDLDPGLLPVEGPLGSLFVNGYTRLAVDFAAAGLSIADVEFIVPEGPECGSISAGVEIPNPDGTHPIMLLAGVRPGEYHLLARHRISGALLATRRFRVTACWPDELTGPPVAIAGQHETYRFMSWGGTGAADYIHQVPAPDVWRVALVLVSTKDRRYGALAADAKSGWRERVIGGGDSVKRFYEEVSYRLTPGSPGDSPGTTIELVGGRVLGPIDMEEGWGDLFEAKDAGDPNAGWLRKPTGGQAIANAISSWMADQPDGFNIMSQADSIAIVVRSGSDAPTPMAGAVPPIPTRYVWGHAGYAKFWRKNATTFTQGPKPVVLMTNEYPAALASPPIREHTLCHHEIGHNLELLDLYDAFKDFPAEISARIASFADIMATSVTLPHYSIANRLRLGWIKPAWLRRFDFSVTPTGDTVTLHATEALTRHGPPPGRHAGIEVPVRDGWSYFFEFRRKQPGQIGDQKLTSLAATEIFLLGTDVRANGGEAARPPILLLPIDDDGDGPVLATVGADYRDSDVTNPDRMHDFRVSLTALGAGDPNGAQVNVEYLEAHRPMLQIRPAPGRGNFKSPDIELLSPLGGLIKGVVKGLPHRIRVRVHNLGSLAAGTVRIHVKWLPFTASAGTWNPLPDPPPFAVGPLATTTIEIPWTVPSSVKVGNVEANHFCVRVDVDRYTEPAHPEHDEIVLKDHWAQSNFDSAVVSFGSPSDRVRTVMTTTNPLGRAATYLLGADQSGDFYRVYVGNAWLRLNPNETRAVELSYESLAGDAVFGAEFDHNLEAIASRPNHVAIASMLVPEGTECSTPRDWWGVGLDLWAGRRCWFEDIQRNGELVTARGFHCEVQF
jgi:hypothetical protein